MLLLDEPTQGIDVGARADIFALLRQLADRCGSSIVLTTTVLLGGVAFTGGRGSIRGAVLGVLFLSAVQNGLTILNSPTATALLVSGGALVVAAVLDRFGNTDRLGPALRRLR